MSKSALTWVIGAGAFAIALTTFLVGSDYLMSHSTREKDLSATLYELRTAQASMPARVTDERQTRNFDGKTSEKPPVDLVKQ